MRQENTPPYVSAPLDSKWMRALSFVMLTLTLCAALPAVAASGQFITHSTPSYVATAKNLGTEDPSKTIEVSIWLNPHSRSDMDALAKDLYNSNSPNFRHWLSASQIAERFAPTAAEEKTVEQFFTSHNLSVVKAGPNNFYVRARGTVGDVEAAFHVQLNNYQVGNKVIRANASDPYVDGDAAPLVRAIAGLDTGMYQHPAMSQSAVLSGKPAGAQAAAPAAGGVPGAPPFSSDCFNGPVTQTFSTDGDGALPIGTYKGNHLNLATLTSAGCAYTPPPVYTAYNLNPLYTAGFNGAGQTIAIIDWCGSSTIQNDANAFSKAFGLPPVNLTIIYTPTQSFCIAEDQVEINIDVEWAHAIAPGAAIDLVVPPSASFQDVDQGVFYAVNYDLGNSLSGSYGSAESETPTTVLDTENFISEIAAISGISTNFSSGDDGDFSAFGLSPTVSAPADSPYATAVGGITLALNSDNSIAWQAGWGNNQSLLTEDGTIYDPPLESGFTGGAGGGPSAVFSKPSFQKGVPGTWRQVPDVSWLADPYTGVAILISVPGSVPQQVWQVWGGTSVACPMFSGLWAIANQEAGVALGQAAPYLYTLPAGAVTDIVPVGSPNNVTASIRETTGTNHYTPAEVLGGQTPATPPKFVSAIWDYPQISETTVVVSFGTDCSMLPSSDFDGTSCGTPGALQTKVGWDNVTGVGVPNGQAFADAFAPAAKTK